MDYEKADMNHLNVLLLNDEMNLSDGEGVYILNRGNTCEILIKFLDFFLEILGSFYCSKFDKKKFKQGEILNTTKIPPVVIFILNFYENYKIKFKNLKN